MSELQQHVQVSSGNGPSMIHPLALLKRFWLVAGVLLLGVGAAFNWSQNAFDDRGYAPVQPIAFSHKQHAGDLKIDCNFCHFNAARGKHAGIPPMSVCMGCHSQIATDRPDIKKLAAIAANGTYTDEDGTVREGGMVHWNRVHRLPDHVYFTHQWHVKAGVACQTCHGPVETMTTMRQHSKLTMGWCLDCHRNNNYVGGPAFKHAQVQGTASDQLFAVGAANNTAVIAQQDPDPVVVWHERQVAGKQAAGKDAHKAPVEIHAAAAVPAPTTAKKLADLIAKHPEWNGMPSWRVANLPESHKVLYGKPEFMNAPTQCSTCHQ